VMVRGVNPRAEGYLEYVLINLGISLLFVTTAFLFHELGHKYVAQSYGAWSEFRMFPFGLLICVILSFTGFLFAAPGAVYIQGNISREEYGKISLAGPAVNFIIAGLAIAFVVVSGIGGTLGAVLINLAYINAFLGIFNMIPIPPLDGSKIIKWNVPVYLVTAAIGICEILFILL